jgi:hypothetical protein
VAFVSDVLDKHGMYDFVLTEPAQCPNCRAEISENTLVEPHGQVRLAAAACTRATAISKNYRRRPVPLCTVIVLRYPYTAYSA